MDRCYHDKQDFKSDLNIEVAREGDILEVGQELEDKKCDKNPGHHGFIPYKDLTLEHLPNKHRNRETLDMIKKIGNRVVKLVVDNKHQGSGVAEKSNNEYYIMTNNHMVKTDNDVKHCTVDFHYDDDSRSSVVTSYGVKLAATCPFRDITVFTFNPVPDFLLQHDWQDDRIPYTVIMYQNNEIKTTKIDCLSFYARQNLNSLLIEFMFLAWPDDSISYIKSSYFKFEPIPVQLFTAIKILFRISSIKIEIHIDEDDGNNRVISGDVVKFDDDYVVKLSESIFQDEVKKCRLVWSSEVIGIGTRLYFQQVTPKEDSIGIDFELKMEQAIPNMWMFDFHPKQINISLKYGEINDYICCIGHPHGGMKMVTFGQMLKVSIERFDNHGRRIAQPRKDCKCKEVGCMTYSCKTCPGSSGSPVFHLNAKSDVLYNTHFMGESVIPFEHNGELVENNNTAWAILSESY